MRLRLVPVALALAFLVCGPTAEATPMLSFIIDGDTFNQPFSITNASDGGEQVIGFRLDVLPAGLAYDPVTGGVPNSSTGTPFAAVGVTGATTGLVGPVIVPDGSTLLSLSFNDFQAGETFMWALDVDHAPGNATVYGNQMIGTLAYIDFSDGQTLEGILTAVPGNFDASHFTVTGRGPTDPVPEPGTLLLLGSGLVGFAARRRRRQ